MKKEETAIPDKGRYRGTEEHNALEVLQVASIVGTSTGNSQRGEWKRLKDLINKGAHMLN